MKFPRKETGTEINFKVGITELPSCDQKLEWDFEYMWECWSQRRWRADQLWDSGGGTVSPPAAYRAAPRSKKCVSTMKKKYYLKLKDIFSDHLYNVCFNIIFKFAIKSWLKERKSYGTIQIYYANGGRFRKFRCSVDYSRQFITRSRVPRTFLGLNC